MSKEDKKQLLLQDFCGRMSYGVKITDGLHITTLKVRIDTAPATLAQFIHSEHLRYYLRSMDSMTEEERKVYIEISSHLCGEIAAKTMIDWLNKKMFDYRGLIPMGLVLEAPEGMYLY